MGILGSIGLVFAKKWIGGTTIEEAIKESKKLNELGENVILNHLDEDLSEKPKIRENVDIYLKLLEEMKGKKIKGSIAVKFTQLGLKIDYQLFLANYERIIKKAHKLGIFVWADMEDYQYVDNTIRSYLQMHKKYNNIGICIQSKLRRSLGDIKKIVKDGGIIRLVKGAYKNHDGITYNSKPEIDRNYEKCMYYLFNHSKRFMIATHDDNLIDKAIKYERKYRRNIMFGMLKGIRPNLCLSLSRAGQNMNVYVPFGEDWVAYSIRRLKEKEHSMLVLRSIFQG